MAGISILPSASGKTQYFIMRPGNLIPIAIIGALAYVGYKAKSATNFKFLIKGVSFKSWPAVEIILGVGNASSSSFSIDSIAGEVLFNGQVIGNVSSFQKILIVENKETLMRISLTPSIIGIASTLASVIQNKTKGAKIALKGTANVSGLPIPLDIVYTL